MIFRSARAAIVAALVALAGLSPALAPVPVAAATPSLTMVGATTYDVLPDEGRVAVTVVLTVKNHLKDTATKRFFFRTALLTVLPGTSGFRIAGATKPKVAVSSSTGSYTNLKIDFGANLAAGKTTTLTLTFDIVDPGGAPERPVRISRSLVSFSAWAYATPSTPGATVDVRFPGGYVVNVRRGPLTGPTETGDGRTAYSSGVLAAPLDFVADIAADRPTELSETTTEVELENGTATVVLQAWPDDPAWRDRVDSIVRRALPILEREIGVPWPVEGPLSVHEALVRGTGGYAGIFNPAERRVDIAYAAPDGVVIHELAHAWFNGRLVADRWAAEAFASYYGELAANELGIDPATPLPPEPSGDGDGAPADPDADEGTSPDSMPLNAWGASGSHSPEVEAWAYVNALELAREIATRATPDTLRLVWSRAARGIAAYQPSPSSEEATDTPPDWRGLLDLLEETTGKDFGDLWRTWVARPDDFEILTDRAIARGWYVRSILNAREWQLPPATRLAMRAWQFGVAREQLAAADAVQEQRIELERAAAAAGATLPGTLRERFEGGDGIASAAAEATAEQATVDAIAAAQAKLPTEHGVGERMIIGIGLIGANPERDVEEALDALAAGDLQRSFALAQAAETAWTDAARLGRSRIVSTVLLLLAFVVLFGIVRGRRWRRRRTAESA